MTEQKDVLAQDAWWKILADNWRGRKGNTTTGDSVRNSCADELEKVAARHSPAASDSAYTEEVTDILESENRSLKADLEKLSDPVAVHINMLRGSIAKPSLANIKHLYPEVQQAFDLVEGARNSETIPVPKAALDWLFGQGKDSDGWGFGECRTAQLALNAKNPRRYWWRSKFRAMIPALRLSNRSTVRGSVEGSK